MQIAENQSDCSLQDPEASGQNSAHKISEVLQGMSGVSMAEIIHYINEIWKL